MLTELDPDRLTPDQRLSELVAILAGGVLRLRDRRALAIPPQSPSEILPSASPQSLAVCSETSVTVLAV